MSFADHFVLHCWKLQILMKTSHNKIRGKLKSALAVADKKSKESCKPSDEGYIKIGDKNLN